MSNGEKVRRRGRDGCKFSLTNPRVKRQEVQSEDGWTVITHGLSKVSLQSNSKTKKPKKDAAGVLPTQIVKDLTLQKLHADYDKLHAKWFDTACATQVTDLAEKMPLIDTAVAIGIGSFSRDWEHRWRSLWQLVLFEDIVQHLPHIKKPIAMFAQDPAFTPLDKDFLETHGITVVRGGIEERIADKTFVFSPFVDWYVLLPMFLTDKDPGVYVGNEILDDYTPYAQGKDKEERLEMCNELGKTFQQKREAVKLKEFEGHGTALEGIRWYWKKTVEEEAPA